MVLADFSLGLDSTDSLLNGCTTYVATLLAEKILHLGAQFTDYPHLVRLNPNIPFKTRGNGAVSLSFRLDESSQTTLFDAVKGIVTSQADLPQINCDPGLVLMKGQVPMEIQSFATRCLHEVLTVDDAEDLIRKYAISFHSWKHGQGLIGALAAIGLSLPPDYVFELTAYRNPRNFGTPRRVNPTSVREMDLATRPNTINNIDDETGRILITPRGPDPVLFGIRGETPEILLKALEMLVIDEEVDRWMMYRSNECTDSHLQAVESIAQAKPYTPATVSGVIAEKPRTVRGGHVFVDAQDDSGVITLAAYEPTGRFRETLAALMPGDEVIASGGVKGSPDEKPTLNLESVIPVVLHRFKEANPTCQACNRRMESVGRAKGYRCRICGARSDATVKTSYPVERSLVEGRQYQPPPRAHRHLTRPLARAGMKRGTDPEVMIPNWCAFYSLPMNKLRSIS